MRITDEQKERAAYVNLPQFLMAHGFDLKKVGKEYVWKEHDSLHIKDNGPGERGAWFRFSEDKGGDNIGFLREYMGMSFVEAVEALTGEHIDRTYTPQHTYQPKPVQQKARELSLAEADNARRVFAYLCKTRGLDYDMVSALVRGGSVSQEEKTGNVLFKYYDEQGKVIGAEKVGTSTEHKFKGIATGSAGGHGFEVVRGSGEKAFFFESAIDMLSYLQMHDRELENCRLVSMMGVKPNIVLDTMLRHNISPENVFLCSDNDSAGNDFAQRLQEQYPEMKRVITPDTYKDWNDMLRGIPKQQEEQKTVQETKTKEVQQTNMQYYGNEMWNKATDNRDKSLVSVQAADFARLQEQLERSGINYYAYARGNAVIMAINDKDVEWFKRIAGTPDLVPSKSNRPFSPPEKNIFGSAEYRYIPQKEYFSADRDLVLKMADIMARRGMQFSGRVYPSGKGTLTVSRDDLYTVRSIRDEVVNMRRQFASPDRAQEVGNRDYRANRDTYYYMSKLTPEQFKEIKPFLETSVSYHAVAREGKVAFAVDKENAPAFHRALENAVREVGMLHRMADLGLTMEQNVALSPTIHRLAVENMQIDLANFFDSRYDEAQFGEMLSLVEAYIAQATAERYGEHSKLNDMLEAKSSFDRAIELSDFFSQHDFSDEQRAAITAMFVGDVTRGQLESIDETFTAEDIQAYDEVLHNALQESDVADFLTAHKQTVIDRENASRVPTEEEILFGQADLARFIAERTPSSDEWEDMAYPLFENGYLDTHKPSDRAAYGYHMNEQQLYDIAQRYHHGEDIRRELALGLLEGGNSADIEFVFEQGEMSDRTYYYAEHLRHSLHLERTEDGYNCTFDGMERFVSFEEIGQAFLDRTQEEFNDLMYWRVLDYIRDDIPDISDETVQQLMTAFDGAALHGWENGDNQPKLNRIKKALYDILGDEEQTEKAFACIAKQKYHVSFEPERQPDSLTFRFGKGNDEWVSESGLVDDFVKEHPDCSFALGNALLEYLDEKQHSERNIPELKAGWYKKTDFSITAVINGEEFNYDGRFDIGDGKGTGGGSLIDHIRDYNQGILNATQAPFNKPEYKERAQRMLDIFIPFLEAHSELTIEEQKILDDFKEQHPIRTYDDIEKEQSKFQIYQLPGGDKYHGIRFEGMEQLKADGIQLNHDDYVLFYEGEIADFKGNATLEAIFAQFNTNPPANFTGHSLSVSDVVVIETEGKQTAYYCDTAGFTEMPEFFLEKEKVQEKSAVQTLTFMGDADKFDAIKSHSHNDSFGTTITDGNTLTVVINDTATIEDVRELVTAAQENDVYLNIPSAKMLEERFGSDFMQESPKPTVADLEVGDIIMYDGARREIEEISDEHIKMRDLDAPDYGGILLSSSDVLMYDGWQQDMEEKGFEILSKADKSEPVVEAPEKNVHQVITNAGLDGGIDDKREYATVDEAVKAGKDYLSDGYLGFAVFNTDTKEIEHTEGDFPLTRAFNAEILAQNGIIEPEDKGPVTMRKVGDFYEMYGKNAEVGAEVLGLHLFTKHGSPMVGFPDHVKDEYSAKLREAGYTVLIEQAFEINPPKREAERLTTLQDVVDKYFGTDCESAETDNGTWRLSIADGDKVGELFHNGEAVCGIYNRGDKMDIEPYAELTAFPKMLADAMLAHNPNKPVEIMDFQRTFETPLDRAKFLINEFCDAEYEQEADFSDLSNVSIAYTTLTDDELPIQVTADLVDFKITYEFDGEVYNTEQYDSIDDMIENGLTGLDFNELVSVPDEVIERHTAKDEQTVELMSEAAEVKDISSQTDETKPITMEFKGDSESLDEISDYALSIGAVIIKDNAHDTLSVDTYDNHQEELQNLAYMNGISCEVKDKSVPEQTAEEKNEGEIDDDAPLFADADVIDEIQRNENDDVPFWEKPDIEGEQLSLFGDPEPIQQTKPEKPKSEFAKGPVVDGVQVYEALGAEIDRGTGFVNGKIRVQEFYDENHPTTQQLADFLKDAYGTGGHSGDGNISFVNTDSKGMTFDFENGEKFRHSWYNVATMTKARLEDNSYLSAEQRTAYEQMKAEKSTLNPVDSKLEEVDNSVKIGDKFRNRMTGDVSEVVSLEGAIPWQTDDVTITTDRGSYATTESISVDRLLDTSLYERVTEPERAAEVDKAVPEKGEPVKADTEQTAELPTPKNLSQLKKAIQPGMMFEITDHQRPECVGERRVVTGVSSVDFTSRKLDENGEPTGKDIHMEFDRAKNWSFDGAEMTSHLEDGSVLMSFHFIDGLERDISAPEQTAEADIEADRAFLSQVIEKFWEHYDNMYQNNDDVIGYSEAVAVGDEFIKENPEFMSRLAEQRGDIITSDRETAALAFALVDVGLLEKFAHETEISAEKSAPTLDVGDTIEYKGKEYQVESLDMDGYITLTNPEINGAIKDRVTFIADDFINRGEYQVVEPKTEPTTDKGDNFTITDDSLGEGGAKAKFRANVDAIKTLKTLEKEHRPATAEEKETLSKYVGWGALPQAFDKSDSKWSAEYAELKDLLTPQEYAAARATVNDAFFTSPAIIEGIYEALGNFGFEGGSVLEPSMGVGNFFGCMPSEMQEKSDLYGVEIDSISGRIAQALYPDADIAIQGFEKNSFQNGCFDVAVGNVPFGDLGFKDERHGTSKLHDFFFAEAMDKLKNGGIMAFVTSSGTLDKKDESVRQMLADKADLIGAIRLPGGKNGAFHDNAGTDVTTDIIFLQKREGKTVAEMSEIPDWVHIGETADGLPINKYFEQHPDMVLGEVIKNTNPRGGETMVVAPDSFDLKTALHEAVGKLSAEISHERGRDVYAKTAEGVQVQIPSNLRNYSFFMSDDQVFFKKNNAACEFRYDKGTAQHKRFKAFIELRDITRDLIEAMELDKPDSVIKALQEKLNTAYDDFYKKYGLIHSQTNKRYFSEDVSYNLVAGLEKSFDKKKLLEKSDIFTKRTIVPPKAVEHVDTALEALTLSIAEKARVDFEYMGKLTGMTEDELKHDLSGEIFKVPHTENTYQTASEYLSGDIRAKLREAEEIAEYDADFNINVSALKKALPEPLKAGDIDVKLGATWIDPKYYEQFMYELLQTPGYQRSDSPSARWNKSAVIGVEYSELANSFHVSNKSADKSVLATQKYGTHRMNAYDIFEHILNLQEPKVYKTIEVPDGLGDTKEKRVVDVDATRVVQRKADDIRKAFKAWIFKDPQRREDIVQRYNELFNSIRPREFDGSALSFPMMNSDIHLHNHQKNAIAHAMFGGNTLFAHSVGAGKTFEMIATAMESKRLGLCTKSLFAVPNHLTEQIGDDFQKLYPGANILVATKKDFKKENRQQLFAKIATGNYDAVIIGHSQLGKIPVSKERQVMTIQSQIDDILRGIEELKKSEGSKFQIKAMERTRKSLQKQLDKLEKANQDDTLTFEQLGIDRLFIDEAHEFKNLFVATKLQNVAGISNSASQKALDLFLKCRYLDEKTGGRGVIFATGTPLSNSITELHTMMRYLEYDFLKDHGLQHFDNWVAVFGDQKTDWELRPAGNGFKERTRIANYTGLPELMSMFKQVADIRTADTLKLDVPECDYQVVQVEATPFQQELVQELADRADAINSGNVDPSIDNMLRITSDGRKLGLDPRLIDPSFEDNPETKLNKCVENVARIHAETAEDRLTQIIFCDLGVPHKAAGEATVEGEDADDAKDKKSMAEIESLEEECDFCVYDDIRDKLIAKGIPAEEIAYIHDAKTEQQKAELFDKVRSGEIRILLGSTTRAPYEQSKFPILRHFQMPNTTSISSL